MLVNLISQMQLPLAETAGIVTGEPGMDIWRASLLGGLGGLIVEAIAIWAFLAAWQADRKKSQQKNERPLPKLRDGYIDAPADSLVALTRLGLGALAGLIFHAEVTGDLAAIMVGASAPAVLLQLGQARNISGTLGNAERIELEATPGNDFGSESAS